MSKEDCIHLAYACGEDFCLISKGNKDDLGQECSFKESLCKDCLSSISNEKILNLYQEIKQTLIEKGYSKEIDWINKIPSFENLDKTIFFREYVWVVLSSGMKNQIARTIFENFWIAIQLGGIDCNYINFDVIKHPNKNKAIKKVYNRLDYYFEHLLKSKNKLKFLESLPHIGDITKYHLARNLGLNFAKPDRHLVRIANRFEYNNVQEFCSKISGLSQDKIGVVDLVLWRYANLNSNYLKIIEKRLKEELKGE